MAHLLASLRLLNIHDPDASPNSTTSKKGYRARTPAVPVLGKLFLQFSIALCSLLGLGADTLAIFVCILLQYMTFAYKMKGGKRRPLLCSAGSSKFSGLDQLSRWAQADLVNSAAYYCMNPCYERIFSLQSWSALMLATEYGYTEIVECLLVEGVLVNKANFQVTERQW
jgi:hypothetical protein